MQWDAIGRGLAIWLVVCTHLWWGVSTDAGYRWRCRCCWHFHGERPRRYGSKRLTLFGTMSINPSPTVIAVAVGLLLTA